MILEFQVINGTYIPYSTQCKTWSDKQTDRAVVKLKVADTDVGTWSMSKTWRKWVSEAALHWHHRGITMPLFVDKEGKPHGTRPINADDCHSMYTIQFLGADEKGNRLSWKMDSDGGVTVATKEQRLHAMDRFCQHAAEYSIPITIPNQGDYQEYREIQEK